MLVRGGLANLKAGGTSREGSIGSLGFRFLSVASGGVNCVYLNFGARPFVGGNCERSPPPPPPPALSAPAGSFEIYGEMSSGVMSIPLFFAWVETGRTFQNTRMSSNKITPPCKPNAIASLQPKLSCFDQT